MNILFTLRNIACKGGSERVVINLANELCKIPDYKISIVSYYTDTKANNPYSYWLDSRVNVSYLYNHDEVRKKGISKIIWRLTKPLIVNLLINKKYKGYDIIIESDFAFFYPRFRERESKNTKYIKIMHSIIKKWKSKNNLFDCIVFLNEKELLKWQSYSKNVIKIPNFITSQPYIDLLPKAINFLKELPNKNEILQAALENYCQDTNIDLPYKDIQKFKQARYILKTFINHTLNTNIESKLYKLIAVGRMDAINNHKGFPRLIQAYSKIAHKFPQWQLEIIGQDQGQRKLLESQIDSLKMQNYITLKPFTTNIESIYLQADIFVMSSHIESLPMVLIEAESFGLPIVAYDIGTIQDCFDNNGILVKDNDESEFCLAMEALMNDEYKRLNLGWNSIKLARNKFQKEKIIKQWLELFKTITSN